MLLFSFLGAMHDLVHVIWKGENSGHQIEQFFFLANPQEGLPSLHSLFSKSWKQSEILEKDLTLQYPKSPVITQGLRGETLASPGSNRSNQLLFVCLECKRNTMVWIYSLGCTINLCSFRCDVPEKQTQSKDQREWI